MTADAKAIGTETPKTSVTAEPATPPAATLTSDASSGLRMRSVTKIIPTKIANITTAAATLKVNQSAAKFQGPTSTTRKNTENATLIENAVRTALRRIQCTARWTLRRREARNSSISVGYVTWWVVRPNV